MTICIVARCHEGDSFVAASDRLLSYNTGRCYDSASLKRVEVTWDGRWHCMFAGDVAHALPVIRRATTDLGLRRPPHRVETVERACVEAYQSHLTQVVGDRILGPYGIDLPTYRRDGLNFGQTECARINKRIENMRLGLSLIVFGYDDLNQAHVFIVEDPGQSRCCENDGIAIIGSGWEPAHESLVRSELPIISQAEMLCRVAEAKFDAEIERTVGKDSAVRVFRRPRSKMHPISEAFISISMMEEIRKAHARHFDRPYPQRMLERLMDEIKSEVTIRHIHDAIVKVHKQMRKDTEKRRARNAK